MRKSIQILGFILAAASAFAQSGDERLFVKDHLNLTLTSTWSHSREFQSAGTGADLDLGPDMGGKLGFVYTVNLGRRIGIETGTYLGVQSIGYRIKVEVDPDYPLNNFRLRDAHAYVEIPFRVFGRFRLTDKLYSFSFLGAHVTRFRDFEGGVASVDTLLRPTLTFNYETNTDFGMYLFWNIGTGLLVRNASDDLFRINLIWNPIAGSPGSSLAEGAYSYRNPATGEVFKSARWRWRGSYIGIEIGYVFSRTRELARDLDLQSR